MIEKMNVFEFGRKLLETNDLDPVYVVLNHAQFGRSELEHWLVAYWCFYDPGTASFVADRHSTFWERMFIAARSKWYPRCRERRHFRGKLALKSVSWLQEIGVPGLFKLLYRCNTLQEVMTEVKSWYGFGDWIAFKIADMLERLALVPIEFDTTTMFLFDSPREGAKMMWEAQIGREPTPTEDYGEWAIDTIMNHESLAEFDAPPRYERRINAQEAETILCKWKSYMKDHYRVGEDIESLHFRLLRFSKRRTSQILLRCMRDAHLVGVAATRRR